MSVEMSNVHEFVGGPYPFESHLICKKCGIEERAHWYTQTLTGDGCPWAYHSSAPYDMEAKCEECGECDCKNGHHGESILCQMVGECRGLAYDVWENIDTGEILCDNCMECRRV